MTMTMVCLVCGGDKWSGTLGTPGGGLHCSSCKSPLGTRPEREVPCTSGTLSNGFSKIGYLPREVAEMERYFYFSFRDEDSAEGSRSANV